MDAWHKLESETSKQYEAFLAYLENQSSMQAIAEKVGVAPASVNTWRSKHCWDERLEAYTRSKEKELERERSVLIKEHAYKLNNDLTSYIDLLLVTKTAYEKRLREGGLAEFDGATTSDLRRMMSEDAEIAVKIIKAQKEVLELLPEGREFLREEGKGDGITIVFSSVRPDERVTIDVTPKKEIEEI